MQVDMRSLFEEVLDSMRESDVEVQHSIQVRAYYSNTGREVQGGHIGVRDAKD